LQVHLGAQRTAAHLLCGMTYPGILVRWGSKIGCGTRAATFFAKLFGGYENGGATVRPRGLVFADPTAICQRVEEAGLKRTGDGITSPTLAGQALLKIALTTDGKSGAPVIGCTARIVS
jgi:hypothetical protein